MKKVLLIDADSTIPNLALMKLSAWYRQQGSEINFMKLNMPYYPNKKKKYYNIDTRRYDYIYCSIIFEGNKEWITGDRIKYGGTGVSLKITLPDKIEQMKPDYSLYPENEFSYGFITRGCIRNCYFCVVPEKEGFIRLVNEPECIIEHKKTIFLDNNILAHHDHDRILQKLIDKKTKCKFLQGLDIRLITEKNSKLLSKIKYIGDYIFAFDNWEYRKIIDQKLKLLIWIKKWKFKFYIYVHPDMPLSDTVNRIKWLKERECLPYIMRNIICWKSKFSEFYTDLSAYCNQPWIFKRKSFEEFLNIRYKNTNRIKKSIKLWNES